MAKAKKGLANVGKRKPKAQENPDGDGGEKGLVHDLQHTFLPGFGGYVANRFAARVAYQLTSGARPEFAKHAAAAATVVGAVGAYYGTPQIGRLAPYQEPISVGAAVAAAQTLAQTYIPAYGWMVSDIRPEDYREPPDEGGGEEPEAQEGYGSAHLSGGSGPASSGPQPASGPDPEPEDDLDDLDDFDEI